MRRLIIFNQLSLDGFFADANGDMSWAHKHDAEWNAFAGENASGNGELLFGRVTYQMMESFWPTPAAAEMNAAVAAGMNRMPKIVFSRSLDKVSWNNTRLFKGNLVEEVARLKKEPGGDLVIMGSGSLCGPLVGAGLVDELQLAVNPVVLGKGRSLFTGADKPVTFKLNKTRRFENGNVFLVYARE